MCGNVLESIFTQTNPIPGCDSWLPRKSKILFAACWVGSYAYTLLNCNDRAHSRQLMNDGHIECPHTHLVSWKSVWTLGNRTACLLKETGDEGQSRYTTVPGTDDSAVVQWLAGYKPGFACSGVYLFPVALSVLSDKFWPVVPTRRRGHADNLALRAALGALCARSFRPEVGIVTILDAGALSTAVNNLIGKTEILPHLPQLSAAMWVIVSIGASLVVLAPVEPAPVEGGSNAMLGPVAGREVPVFVNLDRMWYVWDKFISGPHAVLLRTTCRVAGADIQRALAQYCAPMQARLVP